jgi:acetyl esterase/lipase
MVAFTEGESAFEPTTLYPEVSSKVQAVIDFYGVYDGMALPLVQRQLKVLSNNLAAVADTIKMINVCYPVSHLTAAAPPVLIVQGKDDPLCDYHQSVDLAEDLSAKNIPNELILLDHIGHSFNFTMWKQQPLPRDLRPVVLDFLRKYIGPGGPSGAAK